MEIVRNRDVIVLSKGHGDPVVLHPSMVSGGFAGGQGVTWIDSPDDNFMVTYSDGTYGGMLLWGSNEVADQFNSMTQNQPKYQFATMCHGTWIISTSTYEKYTLQSRMAGPLVLNTYTVGQRLRFSNRGLFTPQEEWTISGDPRAPNNFFVASVIQVPSVSNNNYLMVQTFI